MEIVITAMERMAASFTTTAADICTDTSGSVEAVHVNDVIIRSVKLIDGKEALARLLQVASDFQFLVVAIRYQRMMPCIINHPLHICFVIQCCVPNLHACMHALQYCMIYIILLGCFLVVIENGLRKLWSIVPWGYVKHGVDQLRQLDRALSYSARNIYR